jgi:hypothetical protein
MVKHRKKSSLFTVGTLLGSFFGAAMIAGTFAYFNYKFSEYKFIDFNKWILYTQKDIFKPSQDYYLLLMYSSKDKTSIDKLKKYKSQYPILAIDYYQKSFKSDSNVTYLRTGTNTLLKIIQRFNIYDLPSTLIIKKFKDNLYKQDSMIQKIKL